jgi:hypothetical protein
LDVTRSTNSCKKGRLIIFQTISPHYSPTFMHLKHQLKSNDFHQSSNITKIVIYCEYYRSGKVTIRNGFNANFMPFEIYDHLPLSRPENKPETFGHR